MESKIKVDTRLSGYIEKYEKLRNIVGFHDEHAWRRYAIERIIKRQLYVSLKARANAEFLLRELVLARYIKEEEFTSYAIDKVEDVIDKYITVLAEFRISTNARTRDARDWFLGIMAVEIEDVLGLLEHDFKLVESMLAKVKKRFAFPKHYLTPQQEEVFLLISVSRILVKADPEFIAYFLIKRWYKEWTGKSKALKGLTGNIWNLRSVISYYEAHPLYSQLIRLIKKHAIMFYVLDEVAKKYQGSFQDIKQKTHTIVHGIYFQLQHKVARQIWHSFLYLLITKLSLILMMEIPYELWKQGHIGIMQLIVNLTSPVILLLLLTLGIRVSDRHNTKMIIREVEVLVKGGQTELETRITLPEERSFGRSILFNGLFMITYIFTYGGMIYALYRYDFNLVSGWLFLMFVTLVTYLAIRIRFTAERFRIIRPKIKIGREILYFFALPILSSGQWIVKKFTNYNFFLMVFDLLFEAPYKTLVFLFRDFSDFAREKREMIE